MPARISGFELIEPLSNRNIPAICLTAKNDLESKVRGLKGGAEDYMVKPFEILELLVRIEKVLKRRGNGDSTLTAENLEIFTDERIVKKDGQPLSLNPREFDFLVLLVKNKNIALSREKILAEVWGMDFMGETRTVDVSYVFTLGRLLGGVSGIPVHDFEGTRSFGADGGESQEPWKQENIQVIVGEKGVTGFLWEYPPEKLETVNDNVGIKAYDEIIETARTILPLQFEEEALTGKGKDVTICEAVLSMMRVAKTGADHGYYYLPVWDFIGYYGEEPDAESSEDTPGTVKSFLTLNAVDGSVIDRGLGY